MASSDPAIQTLFTALEAKPGHRWSEADIERMGFDLSTIRRTFKRQFGETFLEMARQRRLRDAFETIADGGMVIDAQVHARFESASAFRQSFAQLLGRAPGTLASDPVLMADWATTPLGDMISISSHTHLHLLEFVDRRALKTELSKLEKLEQSHFVKYTSYTFATICTRYPTRRESSISEVSIFHFYAVYIYSYY